LSCRCYFITPCLPMQTPRLVARLSCAGSSERLRTSNEWVAKELDTLRQDPSIRLRIFVTRESGIVSEVREDDGTPPIKEERDGDLIEDIPAKIIGADSSTSTPDDHARPNVGKLIEHFVLETIISDGETAVFASGPSGMLSEARRAVASLNSGRGVLRGSATAGGGLRASVRFIDDERLEL